MHIKTPSTIPEFLDSVETEKGIWIFQEFLVKNEKWQKWQRNRINICAMIYYGDLHGIIADLWEQEIFVKAFWYNRLFPSTYFYWHSENYERRLFLIYWVFYVALHSVKFLWLLLTLFSLSLEFILFNWYLLLIIGNIQHFYIPKITFHSIEILQGKVLLVTIPNQFPCNFNHTCSLEFAYWKFFSVSYIIPPKTQNRIKQCLPKYQTCNWIVAVNGISLFHLFRWEYQILIN